MFDVLEELTASTSRAFKKNKLLAELVANSRLQIALYSEREG
jgi:hypothetical protein